MFGLGFSTSSYTYYSTENGFKLEKTDADKTELQIDYYMSLDQVYHNRAIYTVWDFFGDVGGLFDMLKLIA